MGKNWQLDLHKLGTLEFFQEICQVIVGNQMPTSIHLSFFQFVYFCLMEKNEPEWNSIQLTYVQKKLSYSCFVMHLCIRKQTTCLSFTNRLQSDAIADQKTIETLKCKLRKCHDSNKTLSNLHYCMSANLFKLILEILNAKWAISRNTHHKKPNENTVLFTTYGCLSKWNLKLPNILDWRCLVSNLLFFFEKWTNRRYICALLTILLQLLSNTKFSNTIISFGICDGPRLCSLWLNQKYRTIEFVHTC